MGAISVNPPFAIFQDFVKSGVQNADDAAEKLAKSSVFSRFAKKINISPEQRLQWIRSIIQSAASPVQNENNREPANEQR